LVGDNNNDNATFQIAQSNLFDERHPISRGNIWGGVCAIRLAWTRRPFFLSLALFKAYTRLPWYARSIDVKWIQVPVVESVEGYLRVSLYCMYGNRLASAAGGSHVISAAS
jgi:hypothetical protein